MAGMENCTLKAYNMILDCVSCKMSELNVFLA